MINKFKEISEKVQSSSGEWGHTGINSLSWTYYDDYVTLHLWFSCQSCRSSMNEMDIKFIFNQTPAASDKNEHVLNGNDFTCEDDLWSLITRLADENGSKCLECSGYNGTLQQLVERLKKSFINDESAIEQYGHRYYYDYVYPYQTQIDVVKNDKDFVLKIHKICRIHDYTKKPSIECSCRSESGYSVYIVLTYTYDMLRNANLWDIVRRYVERRLAQEKNQCQYCNMVLNVHPFFYLQDASNDLKEYKNWNFDNILNSGIIQIENAIDELNEKYQRLANSSWKEYIYTFEPKYKEYQDYEQFLIKTLASLTERLKKLQK